MSVTQERQVTCETVPSSPASPPAQPAHRRFRGKNKTRAWKRDKDQPVSVIRLPLIVDDPQTRDRVEQLFAAAWSLKRALQRDARARVDAYWAGTCRRKADPKEWRTTLGLTRTALEHTAYAHLDNSGHLLHHLTKALALHLADEVWTGVDRHLSADSSGKRAGRPKTGSFWTFTRIPGRARSHTTARKWETFRLHGTLDGHLAAYPHPDLISHLTPVSGSAPEAGAGVAAALALPPRASVLAQPRRLRPPSAPTGRITLTTTSSTATTSTNTTGSVTTGRTRTRPASWWDHTGSLTIVYTGGPRGGRGDLVLPVRLPQGAGRAPYLAHYLNRPELWHKIDLVRRRHPSAPGGWTYEAHLMILDTGYASPATRQRRAQAAGLDRRAGIDGNVSNLSIVSAPATGNPDDGPLHANQVTLTPAEHARLAHDLRKAKRRSRALDRSRRASNPDRYEPSRQQAKRARRRQEAGLPARHIALPRGARVATAAGKPRNAYHTDTLSAGYQRLRGRHAAAAATRTAARKARARQVAADLVALHGPRLVVEDCDIRTWFRLWGRSVAAFTPGQLIAAIEREAIAAGGTLLRASTMTTAMSQHCPCGARVPKSLRERTHACPACGLTAPRDLISALLASCVTHSDPADPATARVDYSHAERLLTSYTTRGLQEALSESTAIDPTPTTAVSTVADAGHAAATPTPHHGERARPLLGEIPQPVPRRPRMRPHPHPTGRGPRRTDVPADRTISPLRDSS
ncbi:hypothetical protein [Nonomuraea turcica]|uniref:hypothetical protein n=1 Tax=Nonomuraea sp. G32 TaxID=3067274 RepID=UPI00273A7DB4|nr:hypothetical protein [Nonomuraea sp. G32]MDP4501565.1 hypothetical protein [Nonomuraea sp. G32]